MPGESEWAKLGWASERGSDSETGWSPPGYVKHEPDGSKGGWYLIGSKLAGVGGAVSVQRNNSFSFIGGAEFRQFSVWLFTTGTGTANGYQLTAKNSATTDKFIFRLSKYVAGAQTVLSESGEVTMGADGSMALVAIAGKLSVWVKETAASPWAMIGAEVSDVTFFEGFSGVDGNGSNAKLANFSVGLMTEGSTPEPPKLTVVRADPQSGRLSFYLRRPDGTETRVAGDEVHAENVAQNFTFGTTDPGGFGPFSLGLTRDPRIDYGDFDIYDEFIARGPGGEIASEGYDMEVPKSGDSQVGVSGAGWSAYLKDNPIFQEIYVDRDYNRWQPMSTSRRISVFNSGYVPYDFQTVNEAVSGLPSLQGGFEGNWPASWGQLVEAWYDCGPSARCGGASSLAGSVLFRHALQTPASGSPSAFRLYVGSVENPEGSGAFLEGDYIPVAAEAGHKPPASKRYVFFQFYAPLGTAAGTAGVRWELQLTGLVIFGNSEIPLQGNLRVDGGPLGSDVVADIVKRAAPLLNFTVGTEGSIQPSDFAIPHLIYPEPVTPEEAILQASKYDVPSWGVYENREFFWRPPSQGRLWKARQGDPGCDLKPAGKQGEDAYTGVLVQFTDPTGKQFMIGPPGTPGCDFTDASLRDTSETNPLNERGRVRLGKLVVSAITTLTGAIQLGARWLQEELTIVDRGTAVLTGFVQDAYGNYEPVWKVRAGDRIRFDDADRRERRIIETSYDHEQRTNSLTLDSTPHRLDALMEKMQVELVAVGAGS